MRILGVDPGVYGGLAVVEFGKGLPLILSAIDVPVVGVAAKERVDVATLAKFFVEFRPEQAFIERAQAMPKQGSSSGFKYGRAVGAIEAAIVCLGIPLTIMEPTYWKKHHGLKGSDKESGRQLALMKFPHAHTLLARKKDHGRADAALIALAGYFWTGTFHFGKTK